MKYGSTGFVMGVALKDGQQLLVLATHIGPQVPNQENGPAVHHGDYADHNRDYHTYH